MGPQFARGQDRRGTSPAGRRGCAARWCAHRGRPTSGSGSPSTRGAWSSGLHMPGAASLPSTASRAGPQLRVEPPADRAHPVGVLAADHHAALAGPVDVGEVAVRVHGGGQPLGHRGQLVGAQLRRPCRPESSRPIAFGRTGYRRAVRPARRRSPSRVRDPATPACQCLAVPSRIGGTGWPVSVARSATRPASRSRRRASAGLIRNRSAITLCGRSPNVSVLSHASAANAVPEAARTRRPWSPTPPSFRAARAPACPPSRPRRARRYPHSAYRPRSQACSNNSAAHRHRNRAREATETQATEVNSVRSEAPAAGRGPHQPGVTAQRPRAPLSCP